MDIANDQTPAAPEHTPRPPVQEAVPQLPTPLNVAVEGAPTAPASGRPRSAFRDIRTQLTPEELSQTGAQKLIIEDFLRAEAECESLRIYVDRFHETDKQVGVLTQKLKVEKSVEIMSGVGLAVGAAIFGLAPSIWSPQHAFLGWAALVAGGLLMAGAIVGKVARRSK